MSNSMYFVGNCLIWASLARLFFGGTIETVANDKQGTWFGSKHYVVRYSWGYFHFRHRIRFLPLPFTDWFYIGQFQFIAIDNKSV